MKSKIKEVPITVILPVLITENWQRLMTVFCINMLKECTAIEYELIIIEQHRDQPKNLDLAKYCDNYIQREPSKNATSDINAGIEAATGEYIVYIGNDIFVKPQWLEALLECFEIKDCGAATLAMTEPGSRIGPEKPEAVICEAHYGPLTMFKRGWKYDEAFPTQRADDDLIMRLYSAGLRSYRNNRVICHHLSGETWKEIYTNEERELLTKQARAKFNQRWCDSPLAIKRMIERGHLVYGQEQ